MITTILLNILYACLSFLLIPITSLPDVVLSANLPNAVSTANNYLSSLDSFVPIGTLILLLSTMLGIEISILSYKLVMWVIKKIPTIS
jgi:hypothetical protein